MKKHVLHIQLPQTPAPGNFNGQYNTNSGYLDNWTETIFIIDPIELFESLCDQSCLVSINASIQFLFDFVHPLTVDHICPYSRLSQVPSFIL
jgi:hypothetical protein